MPVYPFECPQCLEETTAILTMSEYTEASLWHCDSCGTELTKKNRVLCAASVTRASYVDGTKRAGFSERKEALRLRRASYDMKPGDRKEIKKVIKQIERKI